MLAADGDRAVTRSRQQILNHSEVGGPAQRLRDQDNIRPGALDEHFELHTSIGIVYHGA
jgi:hypothetical protein